MAKQKEGRGGHGTPEWLGRGGEGQLSCQAGERRAGGRTGRGGEGAGGGGEGGAAGRGGPGQGEKGGESR